MEGDKEDELLASTSEEGKEESEEDDDSSGSLSEGQKKGEVNTSRAAGIDGHLDSIAE